MKNKTIKVPYLARVEGEGGLHIKIKGGRVTEVQLNIFEPPRFFEAFLRGRQLSEAPDLTSRICGICPVAYQMSAGHAMEDALGIRVAGPLRALRRLLYCGEWIESHALHIFMLHAPDFLGYPDAIRMAQEHPEMVKLGLRLKKAGNALVTLLGGREIHPINVRVGGFYQVPTRQELASLKDELEWAREAALKTVAWTSGFSFPDFEPDYEFVALRHESEYPLNEGRLVSNRGLDIDIKEYEDHFQEEQAPYSHALHSARVGRGPYLVGPLARYNLNFDRLPPLARYAARQAGLEPVCRNPFKSILVREVELIFALEEALSIIEAYEMPEEPAVPLEPRAGVGYGCTEAPRGILYHRYEIDDQGLIVKAKIVPPTAQNQKMMESDLYNYVGRHLDLPDEKLTWQCEQIVRNYDPCISCATHFLRVNIDRQV
ncbi:MAG: Ni/Fe hydrogenase subunit alpha [Deltaproteobacteria bacterium]|nr:Ni/Fe hydrogenase subunit alpha [Deltaproteobacteria bacterium]